MKNLAKNLSHLETESLRREAQTKRLFERVLLVITVLGLIFIGLGLLLHFAGRALNDFDVSRVGVYILLIGITLVAMRIFSWILEEIVGRGLESMTSKKQNTFHVTLFGISFLALCYNLSRFHTLAGEPVVTPLYP